MITKAFMAKLRSLRNISRTLEMLRRLHGKPNPQSRKNRDIKLLAFYYHSSDGETNVWALNSVDLWNGEGKLFPRSASLVRDGTGDERRIIDFPTFASRTFRLFSWEFSIVLRARWAANNGTEMWCTAGSATGAFFGTFMYTVAESSHETLARGCLSISSRRWRNEM